MSIILKTEDFLARHSPFNCLYIVIRCSYGGYLLHLSREEKVLFKTRLSHVSLDLNCQLFFMMCKWLCKVCHEFGTEDCFWHSFRFFVDDWLWRF